MQKKEAEARDAEQHQRSRKWEVKFAPQLATASRKVVVTSSDLKNYMDQFSDETQLRTAMGGAQVCVCVCGTASHGHWGRAGRVRGALAMTGDQLQVTSDQGQ